MDKAASGKLGEDLAAEYLRKRGWAIAARNYRAGACEIDIVGYRLGTLCFFEVKTRTTDAFGRPADAVDAKKVNNIRFAASELASRHIKNRRIPVERLGVTFRKRVWRERIDIIEVYLTRDGKPKSINQIKDIENGTWQ